MFTIERKKDSRVLRAFTHKLADIPGGVTVSVRDLAGKVLKEGTPVGKGADGFWQVVAVAGLTAAATATDTVYRVAKGHHFSVGKVVMLKENGKAYDITDIDRTNAAYDVITVSTTLGVAAAAGDALYEAAAVVSGNTSRFKYQPLALTGESYDVTPDTNLFVNAWTVAQVREGNIPPVGDAVKEKLKGIIFI